jgi:hypothetical protein
MAAVGVWVAPAAYAQSNTTGSIYGTATAAAGTEVVIENKETGFKRTIKPDANGRFSFNSIPVGIYSVTLTRSGSVVAKQDNVEVLISQGSEVNLGAATQTVQIVGSRTARIDTSTATSASVFTARDLERIPVAANVGAIIQLAPNTTKGDSRYGGTGAPSFGGSSASENAYYINGFPVTNMLTQVGFSQLPFSAISQARVITGGYGAEFGRSTGGVVDIITKRGSNDFEIGGSIAFEPRKLRAKERNMLFESVGAPNDQPTVVTNNTPWGGKYRLYNQDNTDQRTVVNVYGGGPIIKDKLFIYGNFEQTKRDRDAIRLANTRANYSAGNQNSGWQKIDQTTPRFLVKLDWAITDSHTLEYTHISDKYEDERDYYSFNYATLARGTTVQGGVKYVNWGPTSVAAAQGADLDIVKYTGYLTDDLTLTALVGRGKTKHEQTPSGYNPALPQIALNNAQAPGLTYLVPQGTTGNQLTPGAQDENKGYRLDLEWKLNSSHKLRAGVDANTIKSVAGTSTAGGGLWTYFRANPATSIPEGMANSPASVAGNPLAQQGYYAEFSRFSAVSTPEVEQTAQYIEDQWQVTKDLQLVLGLRNEGFNNKNGDGQSYIKLSKQLAPRFAAIWDLNSDASTVLKGTVGRYHVPLPTNVAVRAAGSSYNARQAYTYTGVDQVTGAPTGLVSLAAPGAPNGGFYSSNNEYGQAKDPREVAAQDMKGNYQDELTLGIEQAVAKGWIGKVKGTYRSLKTALDDHCDDRPFRAWADRNNVDASNWGYNCALFNPGRGNRFTIDLNGDGRLENINLSAADLGVAKPKRIYAALDFELEHPFDGKWYGKLTYTLSRNYGNAEGQLLSDIGQGDVATTQSYDFPEFSTNATGLLPNDRRHQLKFIGAYQIAPEYAVGGRLVYASGRPKNCIGNALIDHTTTNDPPYVEGGPVTNYAGYGSAYFFCNGQPSPRGSLGRLPAEFTTDLNFTYKPDFVPGLKLQADVFNVFNRQVAEVIEERRDTGAGLGANATIRNTYQSVQSYSAPRTVRFTVAYDKKF